MSSVIDNEAGIRSAFDSSTAMLKMNNFDLIRLAAALQVVLDHSIEHLQIDGWERLVAAIRLFPGVPVFFFVSGFLISRSFENNPVLREFALNRILRIYPGMIGCFLISLGIVWSTGYFDGTVVSAWDLLLWAAAQLSFVQFYNPEFLRHYGVGVLNGSMWTITVELQFYVLVPVVYALLRSPHVSRRMWNCLLALIALVFLAVNRAYFSGAASHSQELWYKLAGVSFAPWFYMFVVGMLFQRNFAFLHRWLAGRFLPLLAVYCATAVIAGSLFDWRTGNGLHPVLFAVLSMAIFAAAFSFPTLSDRVLARNDVSYGVYIYHMPVVNCLLIMGIRGGSGSLAIAIVSTLALAYMSWRFIEKPALGLKRHPLYQHGSAVS